MRLLIAIGKRDRAWFNFFFFFCLQIDLKCRIFLAVSRQKFCSLSHDSIVDTSGFCFALLRKLSELSNNDSLHPVVKYVLKTLNPLA